MAGWPINSHASNHLLDQKMLDQKICIAQEGGQAGLMGVRGCWERVVAAAGKGEAAGPT